MSRGLCLPDGLIAHLFSLLCELGISVFVFVFLRIDHVNRLAIDVSFSVVQKQKYS